MDHENIARNNHKNRMNCAVSVYIGGTAESGSRGGHGGGGGGGSRQSRWTNRGREPGETRGGKAKISRGRGGGGGGERGVSSVPFFGNLSEIHQKQTGSVERCFRFVV